jgi:hypothetical protein
MLGLELQLGLELVLALALKLGLRLESGLELGLFQSILLRSNLLPLTPLNRLAGHRERERERER